MKEAEQKSSATDVSGDPILSISEHKVKQNYIAFAMRIIYDPQEYVGCAERDCFGRFALKAPN